MAKLLVRREAEDEHHHFNVTSPSPQPLKNSGTTPGADTGGNSTIYIVTGVVVPLILIGIGALVAYIWYRKKYPVRMVMGKDFAKFSNPAYNKRTSTLTLVREDSQHYWDTFQPSGIQNPGLSSMLEDEDDSYQDSPRVDVVDETGASGKMEDIEKMIEGGDSVILHGTHEEGEEETIDDYENEDTLEREQINDAKQGEAKPVKPPRKAMLIKNDDFDYLDTGFEIVSESDLAGHSNSETSSVNDSTGTHTIALSTAETTEASEASDSSIHESKDIDSEKSSLDKSNIYTSDSSCADDVQSNNEKGHTNDAKDKNINDDREKVEASQKAGTEVLNDETKIETSVHLKRSEDEVERKHSDSSSTNSLEHFENIEAALKNDPDNSLDNIEFEPKPKPGLKLTLSSEKIYLEAPTPTPIVVPDSIIFESESSSPIHLDDVKDVAPRRQRRAHTIECVMGNLHDGKEKELAVKKDWYSNDDIENMGNPKGGIELFKPIHKKFSIGSQSSSEEEHQDVDNPFETNVTHKTETTLQKQSDMNLKLESQFTNDLCISDDQLIASVMQTEEDVESTATHADRPDAGIAEEKVSLPQTNSSADNINSFLSSSFELLDKDESFNKSFQSSAKEDANTLDNNYALFPTTHGIPVTCAPELTNKDISSVSHAYDKEEIKDENTDSSSEESNLPSSNDQSIEVIDKIVEGNVFDDNNMFANVVLPDVLSNIDIDKQSIGEQDEPSSSKSEDSFTIVQNKTTSALYTDDNSHHLLEASIPERQEAPYSKIESSETDTAVNQDTDARVGGGFPQILDIVDNSEFVIPEIHEKEETDQHIKKQATNMSLLIDHPDMGAQNDYAESNVNSAGSFQQFETSLLGASTPTSMALNDPLANLNTGLVEFDDELKDLSSTNSDSFDSFNPTGVTQNLDKSFDEDSFKRLTTESSATNSFEVISEESSNKTSPTTLPSKKRISIGIENLILSSDSNTDDDDSDSDTSPDDDKDDEEKSYNSGDFPNLMLDLEKSKEQSNNDTVNLHVTHEVSHSPDTGGASKNTGTSFWDVLNEDTEA